MAPKNQPGADIEALMRYVDSVVGPAQRSRSAAQFAGLQAEQPDTLRGNASRRIGQALYDTGYLMPSDAMGVARGSTLAMDMAPGVGDYMAFEEAETPLDYGLATVGAVPGIGDALGLAMAVAPAAKMAKAASKTPDIQAADEVLDLLKAGRGSDVTDELLAKADTPRGNAYLAENYDLPLDRASRMARADEMFPKKVYHGTVAEDFKQFDLSKGGSSSGAKDSENAIFTANKPMATRNYAGYDEELPGDDWFDWLNRTKIAEQEYPDPELLRRMGDVQGYFDLRSLARAKRTEIAGPEPAKQRGYWEGGRQMPLRSSVDNIADVDGEIYSPDRFARVVRAAKNEGADGVVFRNVDDMDEAPVRHDQYAHFNENALRSQHARFDPRLKHLRNLMAGGAGIGLGLGMAAPRIFPYQEDEQL